MRASGKSVRKRGTVLLMIVGLLAMLFIIISAYITLARFDRLTLRLISQGQQVDQIMEAINDATIASLTATWGGGADSAAASVTGSAYAEFPGGWGTGSDAGGATWLASAEPVLAYPGTFNPDPSLYVYPSVSSFGSRNTYNILSNLMRDRADDDDGDSDPATPEIEFDWNNPASPRSDLAFNAQRPFGDADGDGVPDSAFGGSGTWTELANAMFGSAVQTRYDDGTVVDAIHTYSLGNTDPLTDNDRAWAQFDKLARYEVATRIISHGGMVLAGLEDANMPHREFIEGMFDWVRHPNDNGGLANLPDASLEWIAASSGSIEPLLRRRGGLLASPRESDDINKSLVSGPMQVLLTAFPNTFYPQYDDREKGDNWQRFNLASRRPGAEWNAWRHGATLDPVAYNEYMNSGSGDPRLHYVQRQLLTTVNNSDELAREQANTSGSPTPEIKPGQLKYYLGRITDRTLESNVSRGAFKEDLSFNLDTLPGENVPQGYRIIHELAGYYHEMLMAHEWNDEHRNIRDQAYMLAVNTVAFAAPRRPHIDPALRKPGAIDVVSVLVTDPVSGDNYRYTGYAPQPFITQVMAYKKEGKEGGDNTALAVELYNPNDRVGGPNDPDEQALYMPQFGVSINSDYENSNYGLDSICEFSNNDAGAGWINLDSSDERLAGRRFWLFVINDRGSNTHFETELLRMVPVISGLGVGEVNNKITVKLWRTGFDGFESGVAPVLVDEFEIEAPEESPPSQEEGETWSGSWVDAWRDTNFEEYIGPDVDGNPARWRCVLAAPEGSNEPNFKSANGDDSTPGPARLEALGNARPASQQPTTKFGPCVPLYTMNASISLNQGFTDLHGVGRPNSFPTVGFLLYVPRFSHLMVPPSVPGQRHIVMGRELYKQFKKKDPTFTLSSLPADFGHMPIFDNKQEKKNNRTFEDTGRVPWGLLVFDYFTTWDIDGEDGIPASGDELVDPYRIPGRININVASWYVLAGLPVIGPESDGDLPLSHSASPAFWSHDSGVLVGSGGMGQPRYPEKVRVPISQGWTRLGEELAQSIAAYRDRVQYVNSNSSDFWDALSRNNQNPPHNPYREIKYGSIRGQNDTGDHGFLTIGELANVMGFDGSNDASGTVLASDDFMKAVSLMALLDTHFLTTRSNTFTTYVTLIDREEPQASLRSQITLDRTNLLPRRVPETDGVDDIVISNTGKPEIIGQRQVSYFNARHDE